MRVIGFLSRKARATVVGMPARNLSSFLQAPLFSSGTDSASEPSLRRGGASVLKRTSGGHAFGALLFAILLLCFSFLGGLGALLDQGCRRTGCGPRMNAVYAGERGDDFPNGPKIGRAQNGGVASDLQQAMALLQNGSSLDKVKAAVAVSQMGESGAPAIPLLERTAGDENPEVRRVSGIALGILGRELPAAREALHRCLAAPSTRGAALKGIACVDSPAPDLVEDLILIVTGDADSSELVSGIRALRSVGQGSSGCARALASLAASAELNVRREAVWGLAWVLEKGMDLAEDLKRLSLDQDPVVSAWVDFARWKHGDADSQATGALVRLLESGCEVDRALEAIAAMGNDAQAALPDVLEVVRRGSIPQAYLAIKAVSSIGTASDEVIDTLVHHLGRESVGDEVDILMGSALVALGELGPAAVRATPDVARLLPRRSYRVLAEAALSHFGPSATHILREMVQTDDCASDVRSSIVEYLAGR